jgi:hypothetical protein
VVAVDFPKAVVRECSMSGASHGRLRKTTAEMPMIDGAAIAAEAAEDGLNIFARLSKRCLPGISVDARTV